MAERKTGVIPLDLITEKDTERYSSEELVEYILKILKFLKDGEEPTFSGRGLQEKFEGREAFLKANMEKFDRKLQNLKQFRTESEPSRDRVGTESEPNGAVRYEICDMSNEICDMGYEIKNIYRSNELCECITAKGTQCQRRASYLINGKRYCNQHSRDILADVFNQRETEKLALKELVEGYSNNYHMVEDLYAFIEMRKKMKAPMTEQAVKLALNKLSSLTQDEEEAIKIIEQSIEHGWKSFYPLKEEKPKTRQEELHQLYEKYKKEEEESGQKRHDDPDEFSFSDIFQLESGEL